MNLQHIRLGYTFSLQLTHKLQTCFPDLHFWIDTKRQLIVAENQHFEKVFEFLPPLMFPPLQEDDSLLHYTKKIPSQICNYLILLIRAGDAALGFFRNGTLKRHKVIRKYMVRKKQGRAQLYYLKTKGKSRAGSRVRLAQSELFLKEINEKINDWHVELLCDKILYSCPPLLWGMLFKAEKKPFFEKKDVRLRKIPLHIPTPRLEELIKTNRMVRCGYIRIFQIGRKEEIETALKSLKNRDSNNIDK